MSGRELMGAAQIAAGVASGALRAEDVVREALDRLGSRPDLNAVLTLCAEPALARARAGVTGRLAGVPLLVKDLIDTAGVRTTYGSRIHAEHVPERTAPAVARLEAEGAIVVGKASLDEYAWGVCGQNAHFGDTVNPHRPDRIAGGSSSGSAAAVGAGLVPLALGTDTGGSIRLPAAACGVVGLKPALGAVSVEGVHPLAPSFDTLGPMARTVADCALAHAVLTGAPVPQPRLEGLRVGVLTRLPDVATPAGDAVRDPRGLAWAGELQAFGAEVVEAELPAPDGDTWPVFYAEAAAIHADRFPARAAEYGPLIRAKLAAARAVTAAEAEEGRRVLRRWRAAAAREPAVDLLLSPVLGLAELPRAGVDELTVRLPFSAYTRVFSYLGWPALAMGPLQLAGRDAATVIAAGLALEKARETA